MAGATRLWRRLVPLLASSGLVAFPGTSAQGAENPYDGNWHFMLTPYLWLPSVDGQLTFDVPGSGGSPDFTVRAGNILENLDIAFMATGDVRKGGAMLFTDFIYLD